MENLNIIKLMIITFLTSILLCFWYIPKQEYYELWRDYKVIPDNHASRIVRNYDKHKTYCLTYDIKVKCVKSKIPFIIKRTNVKYYKKVILSTYVTSNGKREIL